MFYLLFLLIGAAIGYGVASRFRVEPMTGAGLGAAGGLVGGVLVKAVFPFLLGLAGAALGAVVLLYGYRELRKAR